ncbi:FAD-binding oxidoreductase [Pseudaminobacter arsenicus]|uniref:FAD-binding oxidoreductase n=1 Tax=Borborobacter arsenicus TaxID=1851146 RepID=A0A432V7M7_9HYPH|nr:FAD-binding oxidoreductase [Pseudaminobacter arsenicus]RUM98168.1 FAD-binding oxidoreductase [Pseudaminobacter arsenicus]
MDATTAIASDDLAARLRQALGDDRVITDSDGLEPFLHEERGLYRGAAKIAVLPRSTEEVATAVRICAEAGVPVVPQGGNTGLVGGAVTGAGEVVISLKRMNRILGVDAIDYTMTVEAGAILETIQNAAEEKDCLFPLSLGAEGSCQIGGNIASNAGGINVLRYGNTRDLVLGLEVVLPDGRIWNGLRALHKDNTGYALKHLFIGSEGTLGIITKAVLKLFALPRERHTALCVLADVDHALALLARLKARASEAITAFELMSGFALDLASAHSGDAKPIADAYPWFVLLELSGSQGGNALRETMEEVLGEALEQELIQDAVIAESLDQAAVFWRLRERIPEAQKPAGASIKHDVAVPVSRIPEFLRAADAAVIAARPGTRLCAFGHLGDGNLHYNLTQPEGMDPQAFLDCWREMNDIVHGIAVRLGGSFSAEHGIGLLKAGELSHYKEPIELELMQRVKAALDPSGTMNPGKVIGTA